MTCNQYYVHAENVATRIEAAFNIDG